MRELADIKATKGLEIVDECGDAITGYYRTLDYTKTGNIRIGNRFYFVFSWNNGWEHLSVSTQYKTPTWDEMCMFKDIFFREDEACVEYHPRKDDYVNLHKHCLHIWKPLKKSLPIPDKSLVY